MATTLTPNEKKAKILKELSRYGIENYYQINKYLELVKSNKAELYPIEGDDTVFSPQELWDIVGVWCRETLKLSIGDRGSFVALSQKALEAIDKKVKLNTISTSAKYELIKQQTEKPLVDPNTTTTDPTTQVFQKSLQLQREQIAIIESTFLGKLRKNLTDSPIFLNADPRTRAEMIQMVAYANHNFRTASQFTPDDLNQLLNITAGKEQINKETHRLYSADSKANFPKMVSVINETINDVYSENEAKYEKDMATLRVVADLSPNISDVDWMVNRTFIHATAAEKNRLSGAIRSELINAAKNGYTSGDQIISEALKKTGVSQDNQKLLTPLLTPLSPYLETIRIDESSKLQGSTLKEPKKKGLLATLNLATALGVSTDSPWQNFNDLKSAQDAITSKYGVNTLVEAYGKTNDLRELSEIRNLMGAMSDHALYRAGLRSNVLYSIQDAWDKTWNRSADGVAKFSLLDPFAGISRRWAGLQTNLAINIHDWAINVNGTSWFSGFAGHIGDFTEGFIKHNADWSSAYHFFTERKWGNILDWAAKKVGQESWSGAKVAFWKGVVSTIEVGGNKLAAGLGSKIATTLTGLITSEAGIGLGILAAQILWETAKFGIGKIKQFLTDSNFRNRVIDRIPLMVGGAVAGLTLGLTTFIGAVPALLLGSMAGLLLFLQGVLLSIASLFAMASALALSVVAIMMVVLFLVSNPTSQTDAASSLQQAVGDIVCTLTGSEAPSGAKNSKLAAGKCVAQLLTKFGINPLTESNAVGAAFNSFSAGLGNGAAAAEAARSATDYEVFQCVGFDVVVDIMTGGSGTGFGNANTLLSSPPSGYRPVLGVGSCSPGDFFVDTGGAVGHTGIFVSNAGPYIKCMDANGGGPGLTRDEGSCVWPSTNIAGCLKKN